MFYVLAGLSEAAKSHHHQDSGMQKNSIYLGEHTTWVNKGGHIFKCI